MSDQWETLSVLPALAFVLMAAVPIVPLFAAPVVALYGYRT